MSREPAVGIDLGTTQSVVAIRDQDGKPITVNNAEGDLTTPSVIYIHPSAIVVGKEAVKAAVHDPQRVIQFAKRDMGKAALHQKICGHKLPPEVAQALILRKLRNDSLPKVGEFSKVVITVPAYFNEPRRKATQDAGKLAGLDVLDIINEPTAAAIAFGVQQGFLSQSGEATAKELVLVYDLGGGTFDATLMELEGNRYQAIATSGDVFLGGVDWNGRIVDRIADAFSEQHGFDPRLDPEGFQALMMEAEDAKRGLTSREEVMIHFAHEGMRTQTALTREEFETLTEDLVQRTLFTIQKMLRDAKLTWNDVTRVLLVGGSTRMPMIQRMLEDESGKELDRSLSPDEAVAHGAALYADFLTSADYETKPEASVINVNSHDLGVLAIEATTGRRRREIIIPRNTGLPATGVGRFVTQKDNQASVAVNVIEGGDASGNHATPIGKCVVRELPPGIPAKTPVEVRFSYAPNGRLTVDAWLPSADRHATMTIERMSGLSDSLLEEWQGHIENGTLIGLLLDQTAGEENLLDQLDRMDEESLDLDDLGSSVDTETVSNDSQILDQQMIEEEDLETGLFVDIDDGGAEIEPDTATDDDDLQDFLNRF